MAPEAGLSLGQMEAAGSVHVRVSLWIGALRGIVALRLRASWRERLYFGALGLAVGVACGVRGLRGWVEAADRWTLLVDMSMAAATLAGAGWAVTVTVNAWFSEVVAGWGGGLLATRVSVRRWWIGHSVAATLLSFGLAAAFAAVVLLASDRSELWPARFGRGGVACALLGLKLAVMAWLALGIAVFSRTPSMATLGSAGVVLLGHLHPVMRVLADGESASAALWSMFAAVIPDLTAFDASVEWIAGGGGSGPAGRSLVREVALVLGGSVAVFWKTRRHG